MLSSKKIVYFIIFIGLFSIIFQVTSFGDGIIRGVIDNTRIDSTGIDNIGIDHITISGILSGINKFITGGISAGNKLNTYKNVYEPAPVYEKTAEVKVYFCPMDNCEEVYLNLFNSSSASINCAFYDVKDSIINELKKKQNKVDVKLVIDDEYYNKILNLSNENVNQINAKKDYKGLMHNKFCIIDNKKIITGSTNPTENGFNINNNNIIIIESVYLSENYMEEFDELWNGIFKSGKKVKYPAIYLNNKRYENYFCPEDECEEHILEALKKAKKSVYFMTFSFTSDKIGNYLISRKDLIVKGVFEKSQNNKYSEYEKIKGSGIEVVFDKNKRNMHHKVFIIDESVVITGSYNPTQNGDESNDENVLIIHDALIAKRFVDEFWRIYTN